MGILTQPLTAGDYGMERAHVLFKAEGSNVWEILGDFDAFALNMETEEVERYAKNYGVRTKVYSETTQTNITAELTAMQKRDRVLSWAGGGNLAFVTQTAGTGETVTISNVEVGGVYSLGYLDVSITAVSDGEASPVAYGTQDYELDEAAGLIAIKSIPAGAGTDITVTFNAGEITATSKRVKVALGTNLDQRGEFLIRGVNKNKPRLTRLWNAKITPQGMPLIGGDDLEGLSFNLSIEADPNRPTEPYGYMVQLPNITA